MLKGEGFGPRGEERGGRLRRQIAAGPTAMQRRFGGVEPELAVRQAEALVRDVLKGQRLEAGEVRRAGEKAQAVQPRGRVGRPKIEGVRPWEALGMSRATYFRELTRRRKQEGGG